MAPVNEFMATHDPNCSVSTIIAFKKHFQSFVYSTAEAMFYPSPTISPDEVVAQLGGGTAQLYTWVRSKLNVLMNCGLHDDPLYNAQKGLPTKGKRSIGSSVSTIYESLLEGEMMDMILEGWMQNEA
jgi:phenylalanine ammonia-lyase